jgi:hypothetical protein
MIVELLCSYISGEPKTVRPGRQCRVVVVPLIIPGRRRVQETKWCRRKLEVWPVHRAESQHPQIGRWAPVCRVDLNDRLAFCIASETNRVSRLVPEEVGEVSQRRMLIYVFLSIILLGLPFVYMLVLVRLAKFIII